jgi:hypothetical protein
MCLDAFDESNESRERRNREFIYGLRGLASQSDWTLRYPSAKFPTVANQLREARTGDVGSCGEDAAMPRPWSKHMMWLATVSSALVQASRDLKEFDIADFIVAGSLGKDTAVEHCTTDVDLLLVFKTFDPSRYCKYLKFIEDALLHGLNASDFQVTRKTFPIRNIGVEKSSQAVREWNDDLPRVEATYLRVVGKEGEIVEILPGGAMAEILAATSDADGAFWGSWCASFAYSPWSARCTEFSVEFVGKQPAHVLTAIRALKEWRNSLRILKPWLNISSFALELLAIARNRDLECSSSRDVFVGVLRVLCGTDDSINVFWTTYYTKEMIPQEILVQRPLVLDPAKPWNNTLQKSNLSIVRPLANKALEALGYSASETPITKSLVNWFVEAAPLSAARAIAAAAS